MYKNAYKNGSHVAGYTQTGATFSNRIGSWRKALKVRLLTPLPTFISILSYNWHHWHLYLATLFSASILEPAESSWQTDRCVTESKPSQVQLLWSSKGWPEHPSPGEGRHPGANSQPQPMLYKQKLAPTATSQLAPTATSQLAQPSTKTNKENPACHAGSPQKADVNFSFSAHTCAESR